jgi:hypothetical protein
MGFTYVRYNVPGVPAWVEPDFDIGSCYIPPADLDYFEGRAQILLYSTGTHAGQFRLLLVILLLVFQTKYESALGRLHWRQCPSPAER